MMTPMNTDLLKHSTRTAPTEHERAALRARRRARRAAFLDFVRQVFDHAPRHPAAPGRPRVSRPF